ncbi:MAG: OsmC family protein [Euryarchaeota archaeon]
MKVTAEFLGDGECEVELEDERMKLTSGKVAEAGETTPLHLFLAGLLACVVTNVGHALEKEGIDAEVTGEATGERDWDRGAVTEVKVRVRVKLRDDTDPEKAKKVAERGADRCIISRTLGPAIVDREVVVERE